MSKCETCEDQIEQNFQNIKNGSLIFAWDFDPYDTPFIVVAKKENDKIYARIKETNSGAIVLDGWRKQSEVIDEFVERLKEENEISLRRYGKGIGMTAIFRIADEMKFELFKQQEDNNG